jgi:alpha-amylase/alpha-mannosidase (GH57 family)
MSTLIIHGHFYQPPRENPWTGIIDTQPSAAPYHDWNERIHAECYGPNAFARIGDGDTVQVVNNYANISFNFGPTLLSWLEEKYPRTYYQILKADADSASRRGGHGNAIAQAYGHAILPLCNARDLLTQIIWGQEDFRYRFRREPESLWLPETACNNQTLDVLIDQGLRYVILAPEQAKRVKQNGEWIDVDGGTVDTGRPYRYVHSDGSGRFLAVFFYNGPLARAIAFEKLLTSSQLLIDRFVEVAQYRPLVHVATDGETYGHHFKFGDLCLAHALEVEAKQARFTITNYGEYLDHNTPELEVQIEQGVSEEGSSWSCAHGVGRWQDNCGCSTGGEPGWNQSWRGPLRRALNFLRDNAVAHFENIGSDLFLDPWAARNEYVRVLLNNSLPPAALLRRHARRQLSVADAHRALTLLEVQRNSLLMFTSCGWFFSDLGGIETVQVLRYAARLMDLQQQLGIENPREEFLELLSLAQSNVPAFGNGAEIYSRSAEPVDLRVRQEVSR